VRGRWVALATAMLITSMAACQSPTAAPGRAPCSWRAQQAPSGGDDLYDVSFPDLTHGWAVGGIDKGDILTTSDGGATWRSRAIGTNGLAGVSFVDATHGWAVGVHNTVLATSDGGVSWTPEHPGINHDCNLAAVQFLDARHGWMVGEQGLIRVTSDGGLTWTPQAAGTKQDLSHVTFVDPQHGWVVAGNDEILRTVDGGATWTPVFAGNPKKTEIVAAAVFLDPSRGWESGSQDDGQSNHGVVSQTLDGGRTWAHRAATNFDDVRFGAIAFVDGMHGWVAGYQGELWYTDNAGVSWGSRPGPAVGERMYSLAFRDSTHGWAVGQSGTILACRV